MFIRFSCLHCKKGLKVKEELAGKRVKCAACQKPVQVPAKPPSTPTAATPAHAEELAAQIFSDEPKPVIEAKPESAPISLPCPYCEENISFPADLGGKQAPCPSCRRIIKVPAPVKTEPKDWRNVERRGPSAARDNLLEPAPEGTWGTASKSSVSQQALIEADVLIEEEEPLTPKEKAQLWLRRVGVGLVVLGVVWGTWRVFTANKQGKLFQHAVAAAEDPKLNPEIAAEIHRLAGEYYLRAGDLDSANSAFRTARANLVNARAGTLEHEAALIDLALSQVDLGGSKSQRQDHARLKWEEAQRELQQTLQRLSTFEAKREAFHAVIRKLAARAQESPEAKSELRNRPDALASLLATEQQETSELLAIAGLELLTTDREHAEELAKRAAEPYETPPPKRPEPNQRAEANLPPIAKVPVAPSLLALLTALNQEAKAWAILPPNNLSLGEARLGYAVGWAYAGKWDQAWQMANASGGDPNVRFQALAAVAAVALEKSPELVQRFMAGAFDVNEKDRLSNIAWALRRLAWTAARAGQADEIDKFLEKNPAIIGKSEAQLAAFRGRADHAGDLAALDAEAAKKTHASPRLLSYLARQAAYQGSASAVQKSAAGWEPEALRLLADIGIALGMQDSKLGSQQVAQRK